MSDRPVLDAYVRCVNDRDFAQTALDWIEADAARSESFLAWFALNVDLYWLSEDVDTGPEC